MTIAIIYFIVVCLSAFGLRVGQVKIYGPKQFTDDMGWCFILVPFWPVILPVLVLFGIIAVFNGLAVRLGTL